MAGSIPAHGTPSDGMDADWPKCPIAKAGGKAQRVRRVLREWFSSHLGTEAQRNERKAARLLKERLSLEGVHGRHVTVWYYGILSELNYHFDS